VSSSAGAERLPDTAPARFNRPSTFVWVVGIAFLFFLVHGLVASEIRLDRLDRSIPGLVDFLGEAVPPETARLEPVLEATLQTFEMALVGVTAGALLSLPLSLLAARNTSPHWLVYRVARAYIGFLRSVPDLVWALVFIVAVGLGPLAGVLAIMVDTIGFCGRFFAERIEEVDPGPIQALRATGSPPLGVVGGAIVPAAFPSFVATSMFALENGTRSAVVLGLVGAGGIGVELSVSMQLFRYDEALMIILVIFAVVMSVERLAAAIRRRVI
jgi:phosphonate transport system permease protein